MSWEKIVAPERLSSVCERLRQEGGILVFTNGVFDLLHPGHVDYLWTARQLGTHLVVALNSDLSTRKIKGDKRPLVPLNARMEILAAFEPVSLVTWFEGETPLETIRKVRPQILVKGSDWKTEEIVGKDFVESYGGKVHSIPYISGYSTSNIVERILKS